MARWSWGRRFTGAVPARSRLGNAATGVLVRLATHLPVHDTQTGLRGYPASMLDWLQTVDGDRFEYELNLLLHATGAGYEVEGTEIETIYLDGNLSSHFRPVVDSVRVCAPLVRFSLSSLAAVALVAASFGLLSALTQAGLPLLAAKVLTEATLFAVSYSYQVQRRLVFTRPREARQPVGGASTPATAAIGVRDGRARVVGAR